MPRQHLAAETHDRSNVHQGHLEAAIEDFTESLDQRRAAQEAFERMREDYGTGNALTAALSVVLFTGITFGQWPWTVSR